MTDRERLLRRVCLAPDDDTPRLIYADWLDDQGEQEYAEFIRVQVELAKPIHLPDEEGFHQTPYATGSLYRREIELKDTLRIKLWDGEPPGVAPMMGATFRRGFADEITCTAAQWLAHGVQIVQQQPITRVVLSDKEPLASEDGGLVVYAWLCYPGDYYATEHQSDHITSELFASMPPESFDGRNACVFRTPQAAKDALGKRALLWARQEAGLEVTA